MSEEDRELKPVVKCPWCDSEMKEDNDKGFWFYSCYYCHAQSSPCIEPKTALERALCTVENANVMQYKAEISKVKNERDYYIKLRDTMMGEEKAYADCVSIIISETIKALGQKKEE